MGLDDLKKNMSTLEQILAMTETDIKINVSVSETAKTKILKKFRQVATQCAIIAFVFTCLWIGNVTPDKLPNVYKAFISIMCAAASLWYIFLSSKLKKIDVASLTPAKLFSATKTIKILILSGEIVSLIALTVFFTMLLSKMVTLNLLAFYFIIATLCIGLALSLTYYLPQYLKLFRDLNSIKEGK